MTTVYRSRQIAAPPEKVWEIVKDFGGLDRWVPAVPGPIELTGDADVPGTERIFRQEGEIAFVERFVSNDDAARVHAYTVSKATFPIRDHQATIRVSENGDGSLVEWHAEFETDEGYGEAIAESMATGTYDPGLEELARLVEGAAM